MSRVLSAGLPARWSSWQRSKNTLIYLLVRAAYAIARWLPFAVTRTVCAALGSVAALIDVPDRRRAEANLALALPELPASEHRRIARRMFVHLGISAAELLHADRFVHGADRVEIPAAGREVIARALAEGHGAVVVSGHIGNWELLVHVVAAAGLPITSIAKPLYDPRLTRFVHRLRTAYGHRILWRGDDGVPKELLRVFRQNGVLGLLIDQDTRVQGAFVPFFGRPAHTPTAAASLAIRHDAALLMVCGHRAGRRHQLQVERIPLPAGPDHDARVLALTRTLSAWLEAAIRRAPEQWVWLHDRWRRQPDGPTTSPAP